MGLFDLFGRRPAASPRGAAPVAVMPAAGASADEQAVARYRYLLRTAPPETLEQAHAEAFAQLSPEQRRKVLEQMGQEVPEAERQTVLREGATPTALARAATRAEMRRPGAMERMFGGGGPGFGTLMAGTMLSSMAGMVLGSMVAQHFLSDQAGGETAADAPGEAAGADEGGSFDTAADDTGGFDAGGGFDGGFDV
jgi:hypothetical protein